jgi:hypothetical protein
VVTVSFLAKRRNHVAAVFNNILITYGGIDTGGTYLKDVWTINLANRYWIQANVTAAKKQGTTKDSPVAHAASCLIEIK